MLSKKLDHSPNGIYRWNRIMRKRDGANEKCKRKKLGKSIVEHGTKQKEGKRNFFIAPPRESIIIVIQQISDFNRHLTNGISNVDVEHCEQCEMLSPAAHQYAWLFSNCVICTTRARKSYFALEAKGRWIAQSSAVFEFQRNIRMFGQGNVCTVNIWQNKALVRPHAHILFMMSEQRYTAAY